MKAIDSYFTGSKEGNPNDRHDGISIRDKLAHDYFMTLLLRNSERGIKTKHDNYTQKSETTDTLGTFNNGMGGLMNTAFELADIFIERSNQ